MGGFLWSFWRSLQQARSRVPGKITEAPGGACEDYPGSFGHVSLIYRMLGHNGLIPTALESRRQLATRYPASLLLRACSSVAVPIPAPLPISSANVSRRLPASVPCDASCSCCGSVSVILGLGRPLTLLICLPPLCFCFALHRQGLRSLLGTGSNLFSPRAILSAPAALEPIRFLLYHLLGDRLLGLLLPCGCLLRGTSFVMRPSHALFYPMNGLQCFEIARASARAIPMREPKRARSARVVLVYINAKY